MHFERLAHQPIVRPHMDDEMGDNINGPSLTRVPDWVARPLGRYYLYFAHHSGRYIRLAYSDHLLGLWTTSRDGVLPLPVAHAHRPASYRLSISVPAPLRCHTVYLLQAIRA